MVGLFLDPLFYIPAGVALALAICAVAARLSRLIPRDEANLGIYRYVRLWIILVAGTLVLIVLVAVVILYLVIAFR